MQRCCCSPKLRALSLAFLAFVARSSYLHRGRRAQTAALSVDRAVASAIDQAEHLQLELSGLRFELGRNRTVQGGLGITFHNVSIQNREVACVNCDIKLFTSWVRQNSGEEADADCSSEDSGRVANGKHPNAPGYDAWARGQKGTKFLSLTSSAGNVSGASSPCAAGNLSISSSVIMNWDVEAIKPRLQTLWAERRLIIGAGGSNPLHQHMDFGEVLASLAWNAPMLTPEHCLGLNVPRCDGLFSGNRMTASVGQLRAVLNQIFGAQLLEEHKYQPAWSEAEQRRHLQALLVALKNRYTFYHQKCLAHEPNISSCDKQADSQLLGQVACQPTDDEVSDDCVYAELRYCRTCGKNATNKSKFFEYSRFHGPLALFDTNQSRQGVMGQCEEFSRAGHALLAALGYEVRYVLDFTDHVWIEVRIPQGPSGTWIHADPSEGVLDQPLMYEKGWGKKLTMIFAFTPTHVEHITARYTDDYYSTVLRRGISDDRLKLAVAQVNERLAYELPMQRWGYTSNYTVEGQLHSKDRSLEEIALWTHFEAS
mmetsp:Transcript_111283/g.208659  ORF Transcript_111283/g.208659 Transcript_111283/m.208659 type:complete len:540 (+) Transcript_111283:138-1757(+)